MSLASIEKTFQNYLLTNDHHLLELIESTTKVPAEVRLGIYGNAYRARLYEALQASYPVLEQDIGQHLFESLAYDYIDAHPSSFRSIRWYGDKLASFVHDYGTLQDYPYLSELCQIEWNMGLVFDSPDSQELSLETMANIPAAAWPPLRFNLAPSLKSLTLTWNMMARWEALTEEKSPPDPVQNTPGTTWVFWRKGLDSHYLSLTEDERFVLESLHGKAAFDEWCEGLCTWFSVEEAGPRAAVILKNWIRLGIITAVEPNNDD